MTAATTASATLPRLALLRALRGRPFALLWAGQTVSRVGDHLYQIALAWWVLEKTGSATVMGTVLIFAFAPMVLFLLVGGVAVDRLPRVPLMIASDVARGALVLLVAALALQGRLEVWHVLVASALFGLVDAFFQPAFTALVPQLTPPGDLPSANSLTSISTQLGRIAGPALGAGIIAAVGSAGAFAVNGASFFISALFLLPLLREPTARRAHEAAAAAAQLSRGIVREAREGLDFVRRVPVLWITILALSLGNVLLAGPFSVTMPFLVRDVWHEDVATLGLVYAAFPIGFILGGVWLGRFPRIRQRGRLAFGGVVLASLMLAAFGLPLPLAALLLAALVNGAALEVFNLIWMNLLQDLVPGPLLGRVSSIELLGSYALLPVGFAAAGWATTHLGPQGTFLLGGGMSAALGLLALTYPAIECLD